MSAKYWYKDGKRIVQSGVHILCETCPCGLCGEFSDAITITISGLPEGVACDDDADPCSTTLDQYNGEWAFNQMEPVQGLYDCLWGGGWSNWPNPPPCAFPSTVFRITLDGYFEISIGCLQGPVMFYVFRKAGPSSKTYEEASGTYVFLSGPTDLGTAEIEVTVE